MKYIVYLTTNLINQKIYIGIHEVENLDKWDHYLGCGVFDNAPCTYNIRKTPFQCAVAKYGPKNFYRQTLRVFDTEEDALDLERWLVTSEFIARSDVYNATVGGGKPPKLQKCIYQYDLQGNFIREWESIISITTHFNVNKDRVRMIINDKRSFESSYWSEMKYIKLDIKEYRPSTRGSIRQYTTDGIFLKSFKNTTEAAKELDIERTKITNAIYGKYATSGYWFLKEDERIEDYLSGEIKREKPIHCYFNSGKYMKTYNTFSEIKKEIKCNKADLKRVIKNNMLFQDKYWSYSLYINILEENPEIVSNIPRKVY